MTDHRKIEQTNPLDDLVIAAKTDRLAFGRLFDEFYPLIFAYCLRRLVLRAVAEDVTSDVFLRVAGKLHDFTGTTTEDFRRWLFRIATNQINAHLRQSIRRRELLESAVALGRINSSAIAPLIDSSTQIDWQMLYSALGQLSEREQSIISLRFFAGLNHNQISEVLAGKAGAIRVTLSRSLEKMRSILREDQINQRALSDQKRGDH